MYIGMYVCMYVCTCMYVCMYVCVYVYMYVLNYAYIHAYVSKTIVLLHLVYCIYVHLHGYYYNDNCHTFQNSSKCVGNPITKRRQCDGVCVISK